MASACCKHFAAYSMEQADGVDRESFDAQVTQYDLADTYFPAFQACVTLGRASGCAPLPACAELRPAAAAAAAAAAAPASRPPTTNHDGDRLMCSYNAVNGVPSCASAELLTRKVRREWKFEGYITGDCGAVGDVYSRHHYTNTTSATCKAVLSAGTDIDCGFFLPMYLQDAVAAGEVRHPVLTRCGAWRVVSCRAATLGWRRRRVTEAQLDAALTRLFTVLMRLGYFDPHNAYAQLGPEEVDTPAHQALALEAARRSLVLLKNDQGAKSRHDGSRHSARASASPAVGQ
eukprot:scaffold2129_cov318-Prasinococcus_capsulatus_cf.AAC.2